jgi:hypothetical protein
MPNIWCGTSRPPVCDGPVKCDGGCLSNGKCHTDSRKVWCKNKGETWCNSIRDGGKYDTGDYVKPLSKKDCIVNKCRQCLFKEKGDNKKSECKDINKERCKDRQSIKTRWCDDWGKDTTKPGEVCSEEHFNKWMNGKTHCSKLYKRGICPATLNENIGYRRNRKPIKDCSSHYIHYFNEFLVQCNRDGKSNELVSTCITNQDYHVTGRGERYLLKNQGTELYSENATAARVSKGWTDPEKLKKQWKTRSGPFLKNDLFKSSS